MTKTKSTAQAQIKLEFLSTLGPNPTRKARPNLQLWCDQKRNHDFDKSERAWTKIKTFYTKIV